MFVTPAFRNDLIFESLKVLEGPGIHGKEKDSLAARRKTEYEGDKGIV